MSTKVIVLGETGTGKTSLCNALAGTPGTNFPETVGAAVVMTWHEYRAGTPEQKSELIELWDIDGQRSHHQAAQVFFEGAHGAILVYDVSNKRSEENMGFWMTMLDGKQRKPASGATPLLDLESCPIPVLIVGCKVDIRPQRSLNTYERVFVNTRNKIQSGSPNYINFARFFDVCVERANAPSITGRKYIPTSAYRVRSERNPATGHFFH